MSETRTFTIYGASDDLVETSGVPGCDEFSAWRPDAEVNASFVLSGPGGSMRIVATYAPGNLAGCWAFAPMQLDEGVPFPDWPIRITHDEIRGKVAYSTRLEIEVPEGTTLVREQLS